MKCKKDTLAIHHEISPHVNIIMEKMKNGKLIGINNVKTGKINTAFVPKTATKIQTIIKDSHLFVQYLNLPNRHIGYKKIIKLESDEIMNCHNLYDIWTVIQGFSIYVCGDLAFYATITGRHNISNMICPYCDLNTKQWSEKDHEKGEAFTLKRLNSLNEKRILYDNSMETYNANVKGKNETFIKPVKPETNYVKEAPQWEIETEKMIVPLLHLEIGLVNKAWVGFNNFLDEDVEQVTDEERELK